MTNPSPAAADGLSIADLERVYQRLADAIDAVPADRGELLLVKVVMLLANELADRAKVEALIATALQDL